MKKILMITLIVLVVIALAVAVSIYSKENDTIIGGDRTTEGCLTGAGYSYNSTEKECVREWSYQEDRYQVIDFRTCKEAGYPIMESSPEQCSTPSGRTFTNVSENPIPVDIVKIENDFGDKLVYDSSQNIDNLRIDCNARGGTFSECGSACAPNAEICTMQCAMTCEGL